MREWRKIFHANGNDKKGRVAILISNKIDFKTKSVRKDKDRHYIIIKGSIQEEDITVIKIYAPIIGAHKYIKQILTYIKGETDRDTILVGDFYTPPTSMDRSSRQKINKATAALNHTIDQLNLIDIFRTLHPKKPEYIFLSSPHGTVSKVDHRLEHKISLNKFKRMEIILSVCSDCSGLKLEIN